METVDLTGVDIFSTGVWEGKGSAIGGDNITESTLDSWVDSFKKVGKKVKPRLRMSHDKDASKTATGMASLGWITDLKRNGNKLVADIKSVPKKVASLIEKNAFGRFSPGVWSSMNVDGEVHTDVVDHVALLGADLPANMGLDGLIDLYYSTDEETKGEMLRVYETKLNMEDIMKEDIITYEKEYKDAIESIKTFEKQLSEFSKQVDSLKEENETLVADKERVSYEARVSEVDTYLDSAVKEGKISPAQKHLYSALSFGEPVAYSYIEEDKEKNLEGDRLDIIKSIVDANEKMFEFGEKSEEGEIPEKLNANDLDAIDDKIDVEMKAFMKENPDADVTEAYSFASKKIKEAK